MRPRAAIAILLLALPGIVLFRPEFVCAGDALEVFETRAIENYDPFTLRGMESYRLMGLLFGPMVELNAEGGMEYRLADSVMRDGHGWTVRLSADAFFADGHLAPRGSVNFDPVTSRDVVASYKAFIDPKTEIGDPSMRDLLLEYVQDIQALDRNTVRVDFRKGMDLAPIALTFPIVSAKVLNLGPLTRRSDFVEQPFGAGYYYAQHHDAGKAFWKLSRNTKLPDSVVAKIEDVNYNYNANYDSKINEIASGYPSPICIPDVPAEKIGFLINSQAGGAFKMQWLTGLRYNYVAFNLKKDVFKDARVRQALSCAINRVQLLGAFQSQGKPINGPYPSDAPCRCDTCNIACQTYDPDLAGRLLEEAGWLMQSSGYRMKDSRALEVKLTTFADSRSVAAEVAERIKGFWERVGVRASVQNLSWGEYENQVLNQKTFDAAYGGRSYALIPDPRSAFHSKGNGNFISYSNPAVDAVLDSISSASADPDKSLPLCKRVHRMIAEDAPCAFLFSIYRYALLGNTVDYGPNVESFDFLRRINKWTLVQ